MMTVLLLAARELCHSGRHFAIASSIIKFRLGQSECEAVCGHWPEAPDRIACSREAILD